MPFLRAAAVTSLIVLLVVVAPVRATTPRWIAFFRADMTGAQVVPASGSSGTGFVSFNIGNDNSSITMGFTFAGFGSNSTSGALRGPAAPGATGPIVRAINSNCFGSTGGGCAVVQFALTPTEMGQLRSGLYYIEINSVGHPNGEIRGQLAPDSVLSARMTGSQPVSPTGSSATGTVFFVSNGAGTQTYAWVDFTGLASNASGMHLHGPAATGVTGPIVRDFGAPGDTSSGFVPSVFMTAPERAQVRAGRWYADVHDPTFPNGEIRGQIKPADKITDFDADGSAEIGVFRPSDGGWYLWNAARGTFRGQLWGQNGDVPTPADFDGDGFTDLAVWRAGTFYVQSSMDGSLIVQPWGSPGDDPRVCADFDHDGHADFAVYRPAASAGAQSYFYIRQSVDGALKVIPWGSAGDVAVPGDFDGDLRADAAIYRPATSTYYALGSTSGLIALAWGTSSQDFTAPGDYDADGITDFAVWRGKSAGSGTWYVRQSSNGALKAEVFGLGGGQDANVMADYDGDGMTDFAVARTTGGSLTWYVHRTSDAAVQGLVFGLATDQKLQSYLVR